MKVIYIAIYSLILFTSCKEQQTVDAADASQPKKAVISSDVVVVSAEQLKNADIVLGMPEVREMNTSLKVSGVIDVPPQNIVSVSIAMGGYLKNTTMIPGQGVRKGTVLAELEDQQYIQLQQDYLTALSHLEYLKTDFDRQKTLNESKSTSDKVFQQAKRDYDSQKILVKSLREKLLLIGVNPDALNEENISRGVRIYSPINGYVTKVNFNIGKYINPTDVLFEIVDPSDLHVRLTVFENEAANLRAGQKLTFSTNSNPTVKYTAYIHLITPNIEENRSTDVHCHFEGAPRNIFPGTFVNADIALNDAKVTAVPEEAVVKWENKEYLFVQASSNQFQLLSIETGVSNNGFVEIKTVVGSQKVVIKNAYTLLMKMKNNSEE